MKKKKKLEKIKMQKLMVLCSLTNTNTYEYLKNCVDYFVECHYYCN